VIFVSLDTGACDDTNTMSVLPFWAAPGAATVWDRVNGNVWIDVPSTHTVFAESMVFTRDITGWCLPPPVRRPSALLPSGTL